MTNYNAMIIDMSGVDLDDATTITTITVSGTDYVFAGVPVAFEPNVNALTVLLYSSEDGVIQTTISGLKSQKWADGVYAWELDGIAAFTYQGKTYVGTITEDT